MSIDKGMSTMIASLPPMTCFDTMAWRCHVKQKQEACWNDLAQNWTGVLVTGQRLSICPPKAAAGNWTADVTMQPRENIGATMSAWTLKSQGEE